MSTKHTPGPWFVGEVNRKKQRADINTDTRDSRLGYTSWTGLARVYGCDENKRIGTEIMEANARLIAAAPDLLKALRGLLEGADCSDYGEAGIDHPEPVSHQHGNSCPICSARAAIAKATGEQL